MLERRNKESAKDAAAELICYVQSGHRAARATVDALEGQDNPRAGGRLARDDASTTSSASFHRPVSLLSFWGCSRLQTQFLSYQPTSYSLAASLHLAPRNFREGVLLTPLLPPPTSSASSRDKRRSSFAACSSSLGFYEKPGVLLPSHPLYSPSSSALAGESGGG